MKMNSTIAVLLVEDNPGDVHLFQEMLGQSNSTVFDITHVDRLSQALNHLREVKFNVVLLDLSLPDSKGLETFYKVIKEVPTTPIVVLSGLDDEDTTIKSVEDGAQDYLVKGQIDKQNLIRSIKYAIERNKKEAKQFDKKVEEALELLKKLKITDREKEILSLMAEGRTNYEIAKDLFLSISTVRNHIGKIFTKLRISNRAQATSVAIEAGLLKQSPIEQV